MGLPHPAPLAVGADPHELGDEVAGGGVLADELAHHQEAAGYQPVGDPLDQPGRVVGIGNAVQDGDEQRGDGLVEVDQPLDLGAAEDAVGVAHVRLDDGGVGVLLQQRAAVRQDDGVVVDVHHPGLRVDLLGDLVDVVLGRQA